MILTHFQFCKEIPTYSQFVHHIAFSDKCTFFVNGSVNRHNCMYSVVKILIFPDNLALNTLKINFSEGILGFLIIGPMFIEGNFKAKIT